MLIEQNDYISELEGQAVIKGYAFDYAEEFPAEFAEYGLTGAMGNLLNTEIDFSGHEFSECYFKDMILSQWILKNASFYKCVFENCTLPNNLTNVTLSDVEIRGLSVLDGTWEGVTCINCILSNVTAPRLQLIKCDFDSTSFFDCDFSFSSQASHSSFSKCSFKAVSFKEAKLKCLHLFDCGEMTDLDFSGANLSSAVISGMQISKANGVNISGSNLSCANLEKSSFNDISFANVILDRTVFSTSAFINIAFIKQNLNSIWFDECVLEQISFNNCNLSYAKFCGAKLTGIELEGCKAEYANFSNATLKACNFKGCNLDCSSLAYAELIGCELKNCSMVQTYEHSLKKDHVTFSGCSRLNVNELDKDLYEAENFY